LPRDVMHKRGRQSIRLTECPSRSRVFCQNE